MTRALKGTAKVSGPLRGRFIQPWVRRHNLGKDKADEWGYDVAARRTCPRWFTEIY
ncbi:MAG: hypothetical protein HYR55_10885 [Acidobacteria bacterium]|nr:hypothetical protein [Acidobacteriota bacterium]MBI3658169.1 hypothetical protein [Acidobacteriota bacterium]